MEYSTGQFAALEGVHPNTVRLYERLGLIAPARRLPNGYRRFNEEHALQLRVVRLAFRAELMSHGLRHDAAAIVRASGAREYTEALGFCRHYRLRLEEEIAQARDGARCAAVYAARQLGTAHSEEELAASAERGEGVPSCASACKEREAGAAGSPERLLKRKEAAAELGVTADVLRNWELNGLIAVKRSANGYRMYAQEDMERLRVIRTLRSAGYSLSAILRLLLAFDSGEQANPQAVLDGRGCPRDELLRACDHLSESLTAALEDAADIERLLIS
ncbi:MAG: MerR family transcriptional regulator, partial [Coriobacteriales bacterium]